MRIAYLSDLHLEFENAALSGAASSTGMQHIASLETALASAKGADLVVLAGDIDHGTGGIDEADAISRHIGAPVVYVTGNHEAYGDDLATLIPRLRANAWETDGRVQFLDCNLVRFWFSGRPLVVLGCTLWTDYEINGDAEAAMRMAEKHMHDHQLIGWNGGMFQPQDALTMHDKHRSWLKLQMKKLTAELPRPEILVITHHAPCRAAIGTRARDLVPSYASDMTEEISDWAPLTWIHGHTHHRHQTRIGKAVVVSAPRGYTSENRLNDYTCGIIDL